MISFRINSFALVIFALVLIVSNSSFSANAQKTAKPKTATNFSLVVTEGNLLAVSVKSNRVPLSALGSDLSRKLKVPVLIGPSIKNLEVTVDFKKMPIEPALQLLAPKVFIDYEVNQTPGGQPRPVGIYLNGHDDPDPAINAVVENRNETFLIEGNTEDPAQTVSTTAEELRVTLEQEGLSVEAKKQPLTVVAHRIATELGVPLELRYESPDIIDVKFSRLPIEEAITRLSPQLRLFVRADLQNVARKPFRMVVVRPEKSS